MAQYNVMSKLEKIVQCAVCLETLTEPRLLSCQHSLCLRCLQGLEQASSYSGHPLLCPVCREYIQVPPGGLSELKVNRFVQDLKGCLPDFGQAASSASIECSIAGCGENAIAYCQNGCGYMCNRCLYDHGKNKFTQKHNTASLNHGSSQQGNQPGDTGATPICSYHRDERLKMYCTQCNHVLCAVCHYTTHNGHQVTDLETQAEKNKSLLRQVQHECNQVMENVKHTIETNMGVSNHTEQEMDRISADIRQKAQSLRYEVDQQEQKLLAQMEACRTEWRHQKNLMEMEQQSLMASLQKCKDDSTLLTNSTPFKLCTETTNLQQILRQLSKPSFQFHRWQFSTSSAEGESVSQWFGDCAVQVSAAAANIDNSSPKTVSPAAHWDIEPARRGRKARVYRSTSHGRNAQTSYTPVFQGCSGSITFHTFIIKLAR